MLTAATIRNHSRTNAPTAALIAELWNAAYPTMRQVATDRINAYRQQIQDQVWILDPNHPHADVLRFYTPTETAVRRRLKNAETLRRELGQLDRGTHRACTQSPGGFSPLAAYSAVRHLLDATTINDRNLSGVYRLAAVLADVSDERHREWTARPAA